MLFKHTIKTTKREELVDITSFVVSSVKKSGIKEGIAIVYIPHTTAGILINENADPSVKSDILHKIGKMIPQNENFYEHSEGNSDSHLKSTLFNPTLTLIITEGKLLLGTWQGVYFCEFDGPRNRSFFVKIIEG